MRKFFSKDIRTTTLHHLPFFYGWIIVIAGFFASLSSGGLQSFTFGVFIKPMSEGLGWSRSAMTVALTVRTYAGSAVSPLIGRLVDRYGPRYFMMLTAIAGGVVSILLSHVTSIWQFYAIFAIVGLTGGTGALSVAAEATVNKWFVRLRGRAIAFGTMGNVASGVILAPIIGLIIATSGWRVAWIAIAMIFLGLLLPFAFLTARKPEDMGLLPDGARTQEEFDAALQRKGTQESAYSWHVKEAFRTKTMWLLLLAQVTAGFPSYTVVIHHFSYITDEGFPVAIGASVLSTMALSGVAARIIWGLLVERYPVRYCVAVSNVGNGLALAILLVGVHLHFTPMLFLFAMVYGLNTGGAIVLTSVAAASYFGRDFVGSIRGTMSAITTGCTAFGPVLASMVYDSQGTYFRATVVGLALFLISAIVVFFAAPPTKPQQISSTQGHDHL